jgi:hypothetical protein
MFILYAIVIGFAIGLLRGGHPRGLADLQFRWPWLMIGGLFVQVAIFSDQVTPWIGSAGAPIYVASTAAVFLAVLASRSITGMPVVAAGAACNLAAIAANGGYMPVDAGALMALGRVPSTVYSNSALLPHAALAPLTDIFALPTWLPFANVFSVGDVLIAVGVVVVIATAMRRGSAAPLVEGPAAA